MRTIARAVIVAILLTATTAAAQIEISWDEELAFEHDRARYQRELREIVTRSHARASSELGLSVSRPLKIAVLTPARYEQQFGSGAAWTQGARYQRGAIYVNGGNRLNDGFIGVVVHEMAHAVLDHRGTIHHLPVWLNEGIAERLSWKAKGLDDLAPNQRMEVQYEARQGALVPLPTWGRVTFTYLQCYAAALFVEKRFGKEKLLAIVRRTLGGEPFDRALDAELRITPKDLERELVAWVEHLP